MMDNRSVGAFETRPPRLRGRVTLERCRGETRGLSFTICAREATFGRHLQFRMKLIKRRGTFPFFP